MKLFSFLHIVMLTTTITISISVCILGFVARKHSKLDLYRLGIGSIILLFWISYNIYFLLPINFRWEVSLPLHICDLIGCVAAVALIRPSRSFRALLYFYGIAITTQALFTPVGDQNPIRIHFWLFWGLHIAIICAACVDLLIQQYRPYFRDLLYSIGCGIAYLGVILPLNVLCNWNYGYLGNTKPEAYTLIDHLGPWPERIVYIVTLAIILQFLLLLPWTVSRQIKLKYKSQAHSD